MSKKEVDKLISDFEALRHILSHTFRDPLRYAVIKCDDKKINNAQLRSEVKDILLKVIDGIDQLKEYAFLQNNMGEFKKINCNDIAKKVLKKLDKKIKSKKVKITCGKLPVIVGEPELIERLFFEIIDNAIKFHTKKPNKISISAKKEGKQHIFKISDNGMGLDQIFHILVYKPFQKINPESNLEGTGMGLAFSSKIVEIHKGKIWYESEGEDCDGGTTFYFSIPAA